MIDRCFIEERDDIVEAFPPLHEVENGLRLLLRDVATDFAHDFNHQWVEARRCQSRTLGCETGGERGVHKSLGHLAARVVVNPYKKNALSHKSPHSGEVAAWANIIHEVTRKSRMAVSPVAPNLAMAFHLSCLSPPAAHHEGGS